MGTRRQLALAKENGLRKIVSDRESRLWLVDFLHTRLNPLQITKPDESVADMSLIVEGRRQVAAAMLREVIEHIPEPAVRSGFYIDVLEGLYMKGFQETEPDGDENE